MPSSPPDYRCSTQRRPLKRRRRWGDAEAFEERLTAKDEELLSIYNRMQDALAAFPDGKPFVPRSLAIHSIGNAGSFRLERSPGYGVRSWRLAKR